MKLDLSLPYGRKSVIALIAVSLLVSLLIIASYNCSINAAKDMIETYGDPTRIEGNVPNALSMTESLVLWPLLAFGIGTVLHLANFAYVKTTSNDFPRLNRITPNFNAKSIAVFTAILLVLWLPYRLAYLPAYIDMDTFDVLSQFYDWGHPIPITYNSATFDQYLLNERFCDHHPIFDTLVYAAFCLPSEWLTGQWSAGLLVLSITLEIAFACELVSSIAWAKGYGAKANICLLAFIIVAVFPAYPYYAVAPTKDTMHVLALIPWFICLAKIIMTNGEALDKGSFTVRFAVLAILCCLTKHTGIFIVGFTLIVCIIRYRAHWKTFVTQGVVCVIIMSVILPTVVFPLMSVHSGGKQEMLAMPLQQSMACIIEDEMSPEDEDIVASVLDVDTAKTRFDPITVDEVKNLYYQDSTMSDIIAFLGVWAKNAVLHPKTYADALLGINGGYIAPIKKMTVHKNTGAMDQYALKRAYMDPDAPYGDTMLSNFELSETAFGWFPDALKMLLCLPVLGVIFSVATIAFIIPVILMWVAYRTKKLNITVFAPWIVAFGFCMIGPIMDMRYALSIAVWVPLIMCLLAIPRTIPHKELS